MGLPPLLLLLLLVVVVLLLLRGVGTAPRSCLIMPQCRHSGCQQQIPKHLSTERTVLLLLSPSLTQLQFGSLRWEQ